MLPEGNAAAGHEGGEVQGGRLITTPTAPCVCWLYLRFMYARQGSQSTSCVVGAMINCPPRRFMSAPGESEQSACPRPALPWCLRMHPSICVLDGHQPLYAGCGRQTTPDANPQALWSKHQNTGNRSDLMGHDAQQSRPCMYGQRGAYGADEAVGNIQYIR